MGFDLRAIESQLEDIGTSPEVRAAIRNSKICIVDDRIDDLKGLTEGLRAEGFSNLVELSELTSVDDVLSKGFDLVIMDLTGVATRISAADGFGVLDHLKSVRPGLPVLVVTGTSTPGNQISTLAKADLIRSKPVLPVELASDVDLLLKPYKDPLWTALEVLKELRRLDGQIRSELPWLDRFVIRWRRRRIEQRLVGRSAHVRNDLVSITKVVAQLGSASLRIVALVGAA